MTARKRRRKNAVPMQHTSIYASVKEFKAWDEMVDQMGLGSRMALFRIAVAFLRMNQIEKGRYKPGEEVARYSLLEEIGSDQFVALGTTEQAARMTELFLLAGGDQGLTTENLMAELSKVKEVVSNDAL